jgi:hypothetical protein
MYMFWPKPIMPLKTNRRDMSLIELERRMAEFLSAKPSAETFEFVLRQREAIQKELKVRRAEYIAKESIDT